MRNCFGFVFLFFFQAVLAFRPPLDSVRGLTVAIEGFDEDLAHPFLGVREVPPEKPLAFTVAITNTRSQSVSGKLSVWLNDDWQILRTRESTISLDAGGGGRYEFVAQSKKLARKGYWCYPIHARFKTNEDDIHAIAIFKTVGGTDVVSDVKEPAWKSSTEKCVTEESEKVMALADGYFAHVKIGRHGLVDGAITLSRGTNAFTITGFEMAINHAQTPVEKVQVSACANELHVIHAVRVLTRVVSVRGKIKAKGRALTIAWDMPGVVRDRRGEIRFTRLAAGGGSRELERVYLGFGNVIVRPKDFRLPAISNTLSTRHIGADYAGGFSLVQATSISPDSVCYIQAERRLALEADGDNVFYFVPSTESAFEAAKAFASVVDYPKSAGVDSILGKTCLDQQSGDYDWSAESLRKLVAYGVTGAFFMRHLWQRWGFDYRFPEILPAAGDTNAFNRMVAAAQENGIRFVPHVNYTDFYPDAEGFSYDKIQFRENGRPASGWFSKATRALSYFWLPSAIMEPLAKNQRLMREQFNPGGVFIDVFTAIVPNNYYDRAGHFHTKTEMTESWARACDYARKTIGDGKGPIISEGGTDHLVGHIDASHTDHFSADRWLESSQYADAERVPWQDMLTHGKMLMLGGGFEQRYAATRDDKALDMRLHGYGSDDYLVTTVMGGRSPMTELFSARTIKTHWTIHDICAELARRTFEAHTFVEGNIHHQCMVFSGGAKVYANRGKEDWQIAGKILPPNGFWAQAGAVTAGIVRVMGQRVGFSKSPEAAFYDARPPLGDDGSHLAYVEVTQAKYVGEGLFDVTYRITLNADNLTRFKPFLMFQKAVNGKVAAHEVYACYGALVIPEKMMLKKGTFEVTGHHRLPPTLEAGAYTLHFGFYEPKSASRMDIAGAGAFNGRIWGGTFTIAKKDGKVSAGSWQPADVADAGNPLELNYARRMIDFGDGVRTDGAFRKVHGKDGVEKIIPMPGVGEFRYEAVEKVQGCQVFKIDANHLKYTALELIDQTDLHAELAIPHERLLAWNESPFEDTCAAAWFENTLTREGKVFVRLAPLPKSRPVKGGPDFKVDAFQGKFMVCSNGYPCVVISYRGGKCARQAALQNWQRSLRPYQPGRDGQFLSNTWGDGNRDKCLNEDFIRREIEAAAQIGVDVVEIDDGWQKGRSSNSLSANGKGVWNGYWAADAQFWQPDPVRFPRGIAPLAALARAKGLKFGLWFGPDSSHDAANWQRDADWLLHIHRAWDVDYFKIDSMKSLSSLALMRQRAFFDRMLSLSQGRMVFDLDVTAEIRPGYFGLPDVGAVFVENRYAADSFFDRRVRQYWPHRTLRALWSLAEVVDPVRLRMEVLNPRRGGENYDARDPLAPAQYRMDTLFAMVMTSSPLAWFETSGLPVKDRAELKNLVDVWKRERTRYHTGTIIPIGARPDGVVWTGFASLANEKGGSILLFRECNKKASFSLDISDLFPRATKVSLLAGRGVAQVEKGILTATIPALRDYVWLKIWVANEE